MGGVDRTIARAIPSRVGFHFSFLPNSAREFNNLKENRGWIGVQDNVSVLATYSLLQEFVFGIEKPVPFLLGMMGSTHQTLFWITNDNLHIIGQTPPPVEFE